MRTKKAGGFSLLFLASLALTASSCHEARSGDEAGGLSALTGVHWRPSAIGADAVPQGTGMFVLFGADGSLKGHGGCNRFFGSFETRETSMSIGPLGATRMACEETRMNREMAFMTALQESAAFEADAKRLRAMDGQGKLLIEFVPGDDQVSIRDR